MPTLTLKAIPAALHEQLKNRAKAHHRSLNKEVIATLELATGASQIVDAEAMLKEARQARSHFKRAVTAREVSGWIRQGRV
ncbi:MAG: Arc family DNA-binding protein [Chthoniobacterales bacterium]